MAVVRETMAPEGSVPDATERLDDVLTERTLIDLSRKGHRSAFRALVDRHHRGIYRLAARMVDRTEAEDIVQETFARAYVRLDDFDPSYRFSTWLYRIALNLCRDHLKSPRRRERPHDLAPEFEPAGDTQLADECVERKLRLAQVHAALARLSPSYREAIVLKDLEELSYEEMRELTGTPITALKIRVLRARSKLRGLLEEIA